MKYFLLGICLCVMASSCQKKSTPDGDKTTSLEPTKQYDVKIKADNQRVVVDNFQQKDTVLSFTYYDRVALIVRSDDYANAWGIRFEESFKDSKLNGILFTTPNKEGAYVYNYLESNLNNITLQSKSDTVINGNTYTNLKISRVITFLQGYPAGKAAADAARNEFLQRTGDKVNYNTYFTDDGLNSVPVTGTANIIYVRP
ncbi:hypothetical protein GCM10027037_16740 [Mucilaginibacter koreensis]